jgi:hypothetical protein
MEGKIIATVTAAAGWTAALFTGLALAAGDASADRIGAPPRADAAPSLAGGLDADVRAQNGGRLLGHLHGDLSASGRGVAVFTPAPRRRLAGDRLDVTAGPRRASLRAEGFFLRLRFAARRDGTLRGRGRLRGRPVRIAGVAGDRLARLRKGLRMLVVGRPHGEGYRTLKRYFRPVRYRAHHTRRYFLRHRRAFHSFGALVFGGDLRRERIAEHPLLRAFYGAGKWLIAAPAPLSAHRAFGEVHPYVGNRRAPALAVRAVGPRGDARRVKATVGYPAPARRRGPLRPTKRQRRESAANRADFFLSQLRRMAAPHMATARRPGALNGERDGARAAQLSRSSFSLPYNAAAIEIMVPVYHEFTVSGSYNAKQSKPCGWDLTNLTAWCEDGWSDVPWRPADDKAAACKYFMAAGFHILDQDSVKVFSSGMNDRGQYTNVRIPDQPSGRVPLDERFYRQAAEWGDECPSSGTQTGNIQGTDYYYAILEPDAPAHTIVAASDLTISATNPPKDQNQKPALAFMGGYNGRGRVYHWVASNLVLKSGRWDFDGGFPRETAWFLGGYDNTYTLTGPNVGTTQFEYQQTQSAPQQEITEESSSRGVSTSTSYNIGIFDFSLTGGYAKSEEEHADTTIVIPSWKVSPNPGGRTITYNWNTNTPVSWETITGGGGGSYDLNPLNITDFAPSSITSWSGNPTWGQVSIDVNRTVHLIDHSSHYDHATNSIVDGGYHDIQLHYADGPNDLTPSTKAPIGAGINLCDPLVMYAKQFGLACAGLQASISVTPGCSNPSWNNQIKFQVGALTTPTGPGGLSCNKPSDPVPVGTGSDTDVEFLGTPLAATAVSATCKDQNGTVVAQKSPLGKPAVITVPGSALKSQAQIACTINLSDD